MFKRFVFTIVVLFLFAMGFVPEKAAAVINTGVDIAVLMQEYEKMQAGDPQASTNHAWFYMGYVTGITQAMLHLADFQYTTGSEFYNLTMQSVMESDSFKNPEESNLGQAYSEVARYIKNHPEELDLPAFIVVLWGLFSPQ